METIFWLSAAVLFFAFAGYALLIECWRQCVKREGTDSFPDLRCRVTVVLVVANEGKRVVARIENLFASQMAADLLEVVVVSDGSTDDTVPLVQKMAQTENRLKLVEIRERLGKANGLNQGVAAAQGDIIVFADARQSFAPDTIPLLVKALADPRMGAVSGRLVIGGGGSAAGQGMGSYWSMETRLRASEAKIDSCIGCTGAVCAIRRELYGPIPADTLLDDVVVPMLISLQGYRVLYEPAALAHDPQDLDPAKEQLRKRRTLAGNFQMLFRYPGWLLPWRNRLWFQLAAHKYLRLAGPLLLLLVLVSSAALQHTTFYAICFWSQVALYLLAMFGLAMPGLKWKVFSLPAGFLFLNWMIVRGLLHYLSGPGTGAWEMVKRN
ncbi:MAG: glycosyltransferase [Verrucomicrobiota bacterium]